MNFAKRYIITTSSTGLAGTARERDSLNVFAIVRDIGIAIAALIAFLMCYPFYTVPTGSRGVVTQFGKIVGIEGEGLTILPPWRKLSVFSIRAEQADIDDAEGFTLDTQPVRVAMTVRYAIATDRVSEVYEKYSHNGDLSSYVLTAAQEVFKAITAKYTAPDLIARRVLVSTDINEALGKKLNIYGGYVVNIDMRNFAFDPTYMAAIKEKVTQEQLKLAADNKLLTVESEQKQKVAIAEAEASAVKAKADGDAYANLTIATAQANALKVQNAALAESKDVLELRRIEVEQTRAEKWDGALPVNMYADAPIPYLTPTQYQHPTPAK